MDIIDDPVTKAAASRFESLGQNCEMGFALRKVGNEDGQLLRWAVVPVDAVARLIAERPARIYRREALLPVDHDMVRDTDCDIAFHCEHQFERQDDGTWRSKASDPAVDDAAYMKDAEKFTYMYDKFLGRLSQPGSIFVYKDLVSPTDNQIAALSGAIEASSNGRARLAVVYEDPSLTTPIRIDYPGASVAIVRVRQLVDNMYAETATYDDWHTMFRTLAAHWPLPAGAEPLVDA